MRLAWRLKSLGGPGFLLVRDLWHHGCFFIRMFFDVFIGIDVDLRSYLGEKSFNGGVHGKLAAAILSHFEICNSYQFRFKGSFLRRTSFQLSFSYVVYH